MRRAGPLLLVASFLPLLLGATEDPVDVVVYGDHVPTYFRALAFGGQYFPVPFENPFLDCWEGLQDCEDAARMRLEVVPGVRLPRGTGPWGHASWGKYVFVGNYDEHNNGFVQSIEDQRIGVFDSERKTFCEIDLIPGEASNAAVNWLGVASPGEPESRIYFAGFSLGQGYTFGYLDADMANPTPCDPDDGWPVVGYTRDELNCAAAGLPLDCEDSGLPLDERPCVNVCAWDGMNVLDPHDVVLGNWIGTRFAVLRIDEAGALSVPDVYPLPLWQPGGPGAACFDQRPVGRAEVDPTRSGGDLRFTQTHDISCSSPVDPPGCAPHNRFCPVGADKSCPASETCPESYCARPFAFSNARIACNEDADCANIFGSNLGPCIDDCIPVHPAQACEGGSEAGAPCLWDGDCPGGNCRCDSPGKPVQEYRFDGSEITATSPLFQSAPETVAHNIGYDDFGHLWLADREEIQIYHKIFGEHTYYDPSDPAATAIVAPQDTSMSLEHWNVFSGPKAVQSGNARYVSTRTHLERTLTAYGQWVKDDSFTMSLGATKLPSEARACSGTTKGCADASECAAGQTCDLVLQDMPVGGKLNITAAGAPPSLWTIHGFQGANPSKAVKSAYLLRVPLATAIPDSVTDARPGVAWNGGDCTAHPRQCRLWLVAPREGVMRVRIRDDGLWSGWHDLPGDPGQLLGGPAVVATGESVEVFARGTDGLVRRTRLTSSVRCQPQACQWSAWETLPGSPATTQAIAAAHGDGTTMVAVRPSSDLRIWAALDEGEGFGPFVPLDGGTTALPPSVTWHPADGKFWVAVSLYVVGQVWATTWDGTTVAPWTQVGSAGSLAPWLGSPTLASDGSRVHAYVAKTGFPQRVYHALHNGEGWGSWRELVSLATSPRQPAAANVNGEINLITSWANTPLAEQATD